MAQIQNQSLPMDKFLLLAVNLLHGALMEPSRTRAKRVFKELHEGRAVALRTIEMEDKSRAQFGLALDHSEFRGRLNYGAFCASVESLVANIAGTLKEGREITVFNAREGRDSTIFGISGPTVEDDQPNVLVLAVEPGRDNVTILRLMYLDPEQFKGQQQAG